MSISQRCKICRKMSKLGSDPCHGKTNLNYQVRVQLPDGKCISKLCPSLDLAKKVENKFKTLKVEEQIFDIRKVPSLDEVWSKYIAWAQFNKSSWKDDRQRWEKHVAPYLKSDIKLNQIRPSDINNILNRMRETHKPATVKQVLSLVRRVFNWSAKQGLHQEKNPCQSVESPKFDNRVTNVMSKEELNGFKKLVEQHPNIRFRLAVQYALYTGKRRGEILKLAWDDIDLINGIVTYRHTKNGRTQTLPVNRIALQVLQQAHELMISDYVFPNTTGRYYTNFTKSWREFKIKHRLKIRFHDLRHNFATLLCSSGKVDLYTIKELLGHKSIEMTMRYSHLTNQALRRAVDILED